VRGALITGLAMLFAPLVLMPLALGFDVPAQKRQR